MYMLDEGLGIALRGLDGGCWNGIYQGRKKSGEKQATGSSFGIQHALNLLVQRSVV